MAKDNDLGTGGKAAIAGAVGSAALAAVLLYADRRKKREEARVREALPCNEPLETD